MLTKLSEADKISRKLNSIKNSTGSPQLKKKKTVTKSSKESD